MRFAGVFCVLLHVPLHIYKHISILPSNVMLRIQTLSLRGTSCWWCFPCWEHYVILKKSVRKTCTNLSDNIRQGVKLSVSDFSRNFKIMSSCLHVAVGNRFRKTSNFVQCIMLGTFNALSKGKSLSDSNLNSTKYFLYLIGSPTFIALIWFFISFQCFVYFLMLLCFHL